MFDNWNNDEYLFDFFFDNEEDLKSGYFDNITIEEATEKVAKEAQLLRRKLIELAKSGVTDRTQTLDTIFKPLNNNEYQISKLQQTKAKAPVKKKMIRLYAIRIDANCFVITGGGIKLTEVIERDYLKKELRKLKVSKNYLSSEGLIDESDFEILVNS